MKQSEYINKQHMAEFELGYLLLVLLDLVVCFFVCWGIFVCVLSHLSSIATWERK